MGLCLSGQSQVGPTLYCGVTAIGVIFAQRCRSDSVSHSPSFVRIPLCTDAPLAVGLSQWPVWSGEFWPMLPPPWFAGTRGPE